MAYLLHDVTPVNAMSKFAGAGLWLREHCGPWVEDMTLFVDTASMRQWADAYKNLKLFIDCPKQYNAVRITHIVGEGWEWYSLLCREEQGSEFHWWVKIDDDLLALQFKLMFMDS